MGADTERRAIFNFDRISAQKQSEKVKNHIHDFVPNTSIFYAGSCGTPGIQAADCLAGGIAEDIKKGTNWLDYLDSTNIVQCSSAALIQLENDLDEYETGP